MTESWAAARQAREAHIEMAGISHRASARALWQYPFIAIVLGTAVGLVLLGVFEIDLVPLLVFTFLCSVALAAAFAASAHLHRDQARGHVAPVPMLYDDCARRIVQRCESLGMSPDDIRYLFLLTKADRAFNVRLLENFWRYGSLVFGFVIGKVDTRLFAIPPLVLVIAIFWIINRFALVPYLERALLSEAIDRYAK